MKALCISNFRIGNNNIKFVKGEWYENDNP